MLASEKNNFWSELKQWFHQIEVEKSINNAKSLVFGIEATALSFIYTKTEKRLDQILIHFGMEPISPHNTAEIEIQTERATRHSGGDLQNCPRPENVSDTATHLKWNEEKIPYNLLLFLAEVYELKGSRKKFDILSQLNEIQFFNKTEDQLCDDIKKYLKALMSE